MKIEITVQRFSWFPARSSPVIRVHWRSFAVQSVNQSHAPFQAQREWVMWEGRQKDWGQKNVELAKYLHVTPLIIRGAALPPFQNSSIPTLAV